MYLTLEFNHFVSAGYGARRTPSTIIPIFPLNFTILQTSNAFGGAILT